jgi:hypothetical protein
LPERAEEVSVSKRECTFKKSDVKRALDAADMAGKRVSRIEIDRTGKIILEIVNDAPDTAANPWDADL